MDAAGKQKTGTEVTIATIGAGIIIRGNVECAHDLQVDGHVMGDIVCPTLLLSEGGLIDGSVKAERVRVSGKVEGTVHTGDLAIEATGRIKGDVSFARLKVSAGGAIKGMMDHREDDVVVDAAPLKLVGKGDDEPRRVYGD